MRRLARWCGPGGAVPAAVFLLSLAGCAGVETEVEEPARDHRVSAAPAQPPPISDTHPYQINEYLIYPVQHGPVEDLALTLEPLFQSRYGSGVRVIPHVPSNKLLIYVPPLHERGQRGGAERSPGAPRSTNPRGTNPRGR